jgi:hypothetical protein
MMGPYGSCSVRDPDTFEVFSSSTPNVAASEVRLVETNRFGGSYVIVALDPVSPNPR